MDTNRNIFKLMEEEFKQGKAVLGRSVLGHPMLGGGFPDDDDPEPEFDIEAPRDYSDDSAGVFVLTLLIFCGLDYGSYNAVFITNRIFCPHRMTDQVEP